MCANRVADTIECYMDELIDCFEDFVKKSLIILMIGIAAVVGMLVYLLKTLSDRSPTNNVSEGAACEPNLDTEVFKNQDRIYKRKLTKRSSGVSLDKASFCKINTKVNTVSSFTNTEPLTKNPNFDEKVLRNVGQSSCSKLQCCERTNSHSYIPCRVPVPCMPLPKRKSVHAVRPNRSQHFIPSMPICPKSLTKKASCCSICCDDDLI